MNAYLIGLEIDPVTVGKIYDRLPLHCTLVNWFNSNRSSDDLVDRITPRLKQTRRLLLSSGESAACPVSPEKRSGPRKIPGNRIYETDELTLARSQVIKTLGMSALRYGTINNRYGETAFHVAVNNSGQRFVEGTRQIANAAFIVSALDPDAIMLKQVIARIPLAF